MPAKRTKPPKDAPATIREMTERGHSLIGIAAHFKVSKDMLANWIERYPAIDEAVEIGRDAQRQKLYEMLLDKGITRKDTLSALSVLNSMHGWRPETKNSKVDVSVDVKVQNVMVVHDHGTDEEWKAKSAAHQANLVLNAGSQDKALPAPKVIEDAIVILPEETYPAWMPAEFRKPKAPPAPPQAPEYIEADYGQPQPPAPPSAPSWRQNS